MSRFLEHFQQEELMIRDFSSKTPLFFNDLSMLLGIFTADYNVAKQHLPSDDFKLISPFPGKALIGINCFEYKSTDVGAYNEVSIAVAVEKKGIKPGFISIINSTLINNFHANILQLPVTTEVALHGGLDFFNYPKFLANIEYSENEKERICTVTDKSTKELLYRFSGKKIKTKKLDQNKPFNKLSKALYNSYPTMDSKLLKADLLVNQIEKGMQWMGNSFTIEIGTHEKSKLLRDLNPKKQMQYMYLPKAEAILFEPKSY